MTTQLLSTKLFIPPTRPELVPRPRLIERLNEGLYRKLTLISAPAGFGKTTLVTEWLDNLHSEAENKIAWLSLDEGDNDPARFLSYFIAALNQIEGTGAAFGKGALSMLQSPQPPPPEAVLTTLINEIATIPDRIILVIDDYHLIEAQPIHDAISFLLEHLPSQMHLVTATREDPHLPLARLRAKDQLTELRATDLRFTTTEATEFLNQVMGLSLSVEDIAALEIRTEGWIAGLQLAAISLKGHEDADDLIAAFTGSHRFVLDYLIEEVLEKQPESVQTFLFQTAVLDQLTGALCDALTGQNNGQATLEILEHANLFIVPLDGDRRWYRYHHLFADLLRQRLNQIQPEQVPVLHLKASIWYEQNGFINEAIEYALRAKDYERTATLIEIHVNAFWNRGEHGKLRRWLIELPEELVFSRPQICIFHALYLFTSGQLGAAERDLQIIEQILESNTDQIPETSPLAHAALLPDTDRMKLQGRLAAIRAFMGSYTQGDASGIIQHARRALEYLPEQDSSMRIITAIALGDAHTFQGDMAAAYQVQREAVEAIKATGNIYFLIVVNLKVANTLREQGHLKQTVEICEQQIQLAIKNRLSRAGIIGWLLAIWGEALAELNDMDEAIDLVKKGVEFPARGGDVAMLSWSYLCLMRVLFSKGDMNDVEEIIEKMDKIGRESHLPPWITSQMAVWQTRLWLAQNKLEAAIQWAEGRKLVVDGDHKPVHELDYFWLIEYLGLARVLFAQGRLDETAKLLQQLLEAAEKGDRTTRVIEILLLQAMVFQAEENATGAMTAIERALTLAEPLGFIRIFVDQGPSMGKLLYEALDREIAPDYVRRLLAAFPVPEQGQTVPPESQVSESDYFEPLSEREIEVLQLIAEGLTNQEIGSRLYLSLNTVKVHTRNIYGKLGVKNRTKAISKAKALGILQ
ncbi:LuxR C-terminal-related transcriptional regulator [Chloroflexota bacterium]